MCALYKPLFLLSTSVSKYLDTNLTLEVLPLYCTLCVGIESAGFHKR